MSVSVYQAEVLKDLPLSYYRMAALTGSSEADLGSLAATATINNTPTLGVPGATGDGNTAMTFVAASTQYVSAPDVDGYSIGTTGNLTVECFASWAASPGATQCIVSKAGAGSQFEWGWQLNSSGKLIFVVWTLAGAVAVAQTLPGSPAAGVLHHLAASIKNNGDGTTQVRCLLDGVAVSTASFTTASIGNGTALLTVATRWANDQYFDGTVDEVAIYGTPLSDTRIATHYASRFNVWTTVNDLADNTAATNAGYTRTQRTKLGAFGVTEFLSEYSITLKPAVGSPLVFSATGSSFVNQAGADTAALAALNAKRRMRYLGSAGAASGGPVASTLHGDALLVDVS